MIGKNTCHDHLWRDLQRTNYFEIDETPYTEYPDTTEGFINPFILEQSWKKMKKRLVCSVDLVLEKKEKNQNKTNKKKPKNKTVFNNMWLIMEYFTGIFF